MVQAMGAAAAAEIPKPDVPGWLADPLSAAIGLRDRQTIAMVQRAVDTQNVVLAFQPVVMAARPGMAAFYEGLAAGARPHWPGDTGRRVHRGGRNERVGPQA
jgi:hypothetical protein